MILLGVGKAGVDLLLTGSLFPASQGVGYALGASLILVLGVLLLAILGKRWILMFLLTLIGISTFGTGVVIYNASFWADTPHKELGIWLGSVTQEGETVVYDKKSCVDLIKKSDQRGLCEKGLLFIPSAFWVNAKVRVGKPEEGDYFVTTNQEEAKEPLKRFGDFGVYKSFKGGR